MTSLLLLFKCISSASRALLWILCLWARKNIMEKWFYALLSKLGERKYAKTPSINIHQQTRSTALDFIRRTPDWPVPVEDRTLSLILKVTRTSPPSGAPPVRLPEPLICRSDITAGGWATCHVEWSDPELRGVLEWVTSDSDTDQQAKNTQCPRSAFKQLCPLLLFWDEKEKINSLSGGCHVL